MIDIHSHVLPGLDDGSRSLEESVAMLELAAGSGTTDIVATPHANYQYPFDPALVDGKIAELRAAAGTAVRIHPGCDFHLFRENIDDAVQFPARYTINHGKYLLVEFEEFIVGKTLHVALERLQNAGLIPIITHPERNSILARRPEDIQVLVDQGCLVQVTAQSFTGRFGRAARRTAERLLEVGLIHFVASDAHDTDDRPPVLRPAYQWVATRLSKEKADLLFVQNPAAVLQSGSIDLRTTREPGRLRKWYQFRR